MFYKILEKYSQLKSEHQAHQSEDANKILNIEEEVMKKFLELYDKDVKVIHSNQELIEKDLQFLNKETDKLTTTTKQAVNLYDHFLEYLKEAGDLYNWCNIIEKDMSDIHTAIASRHKSSEMINSNTENLEEENKKEESENN